MERYTISELAQTKGIATPVADALLLMEKKLAALEARATAAEAREAKLRERAQALLDHIGPENSRVYAHDVPVRLLRASIEENQRGQG